MPDKPPYDLRTKEGREWKKQQELDYIRELDVPHRILTEGVERDTARAPEGGVFKGDCGHWISAGGGHKFTVATSAPGYFLGSTVTLCRRCVERL